MQALRLRRFVLGTFVYVLATALVGVGWALGRVPMSTLLGAAAAFVAINLGLYAAIRTGFNLRFKDPSLTRFQIQAAITVLMYLIYHLDSDRQLALSVCFIVFLFGVFRLTAREFTFLTLYTLAAYALVINLLMHLRPQVIQDVHTEWMAWLGLAGLLPYFTVVGQQINGLRVRLRDSEAHFRLLVEMSSDFFWETDAEHRIMKRSVDLMSSRVSVFRTAPKIGERRWEIPYTSPDEAGWREHRAALDAHRPFRDFELSRLGIDGIERHVAISGDPVFDAKGAFTGYRGVGTDITDRKRADQALRDSARDLRMFADDIPAMAVSWGTDLRCRFANRMFADYFGFLAQDLIGKHAREVLGEEAYEEVKGQFALALQGYPVVYQRVRKLEDGEIRHLEIKLLPDMDDQGNVLGCFSQAIDITEHKLVEQRIQRVAHHDSLTGLPNRLLFTDRLDQAISAAKRDCRQFALLYLDLNLFKPVNDRLGHAVGDELLKGVAARIRRAVRESDTVARVGGDEFTLILPDIAGREEAEGVAGKIVEALAVPFELGSPKQSVQSGTSIGIAIYPTDALDAEALIKAADAGMYRSKQAGILSRAA
jgi:diguanylate cyclase (GGDEF)-like protein/PAS domain S-box-containing protein